MRTINRRALAGGAISAVFWVVFSLFFWSDPWWHSVVIGILLGLVMYFVYAWDTRKHTHR